MSGVKLDRGGVSRWFILWCEKFNSKRRNMYNLMSFSFFVFYICL